MRWLPWPTEVHALTGCAHPTRLSSSRPPVGGHPEGVEGRARALAGRRLSPTVSARRGREAGFSLLEALLAAAVLALAVVPVMQGFSLGARLAALGRQYTQAALLAQSELTELMLEENLATVEPEGEFADAPLPGARWSFTLEDTGTPGLGRLTVTVAWGGVGTGGVGERQLSLSALRPDFTVLPQTAGGSATPASAGSTASGGGGP